MNYQTLTADEYADFVVKIISAFEGLETKARDTKDGEITIGFLIDLS